MWARMWRSRPAKGQKSADGDKNRRQRQKKAFQGPNLGIIAYICSTLTNLRLKMKRKTNTAYMRLITLLMCSAFCFADAWGQTLAQQYRSLWAEAQELYDQAVGYRSREVSLKADNLSSNASDYQEGKHLEYLLDGDPNTFWHSDWHNQVQETHYLQMDLDETLSGHIALYVRRRDTPANHITLMGCYASRDGQEWTSLGNIPLPNAYSGAEVTTNPVSLGADSCSHLRFTFLQNSEGGAFAHFAEIRLLSVEVLGESMMGMLGKEMSELLTQLRNGQALQDEDISEEHLRALLEAKEALAREMERVSNGLLPSYMTQLTNLPTLFINTYDGTAVTSKREYKLARMWRLDGDSVAAYDSLRIRGRGNSTWGMAKKPYRLKFNRKERFLGKEHANAKSWTLLANHSDKTLLRNAVASFIGKQLGQPFVPSAEFADVVLNGEYLGNYQISDQMQVHRKRVEIAEQKDVPLEGADISGGYFFEFAGTLDGELSYFHSRRGQAVAIKSPDDDVITSEQKDYLASFINDFEDRLYSSDYQDSVLGYRQVVDSNTLASWFVANEYTANPDGYYSTYAYKERGDHHLYWGPMWDYDIAFNNCYRLRMDMTDKLMLHEGYSSGKMKEYVQRMYADEWFRQLAGRVWHKAVCQDGIVEKTLAYVDSMAQVIGQSQERNFEKWPIDSRVYDELVLFSTYQEGVDYLKKFLQEHAEYLSSTLPNPDGLTPPLPAPNNPMGVESDALYFIYNVGTGNVADIGSTTGSALCTWAPDRLRITTQLWQLTPVTGNYYRITLQGSNLAITDMARYNGTSYSTGARLQLAEATPDDDRQLWEFQPAAEHFAIVNKATGLGWNNSGGKPDNGNPIISWTSDESNASKPTRQWYILRGELPSDIASTWEDSDPSYSVTYDRSSQSVHLRAPASIDPSGTLLTVHDVNGRLIGTGNAHTPISLSAHPSGIYILSWTVQSTRRTIKFRKP